MGTTARFVGRTDELATLVELLAIAESGDGARGAVVAVVGEPGAGKTALVDVATRSRPTAWARGREGGGAPPLWMWSQILGEPVIDAARASGTGADRFQVFDALARRLVARHAVEPRVIVLDDLQWADDESLAFVDFFVPDAEQHGIVVVATVRRGELVHMPLRATVLDLGGLSREDVARLLVSSGGAGDVDGELVESVWRHTGGNPFFIGEVDRLLRSTGREANAEQWRSIVPEGVRSVLARRFARLPHRASRTLFVAAELGEAIWPPTLAAVLAGDLDEVLADLDSASAAGLVRTTGGLEVAFSHSLVREVARAELPPSERRAVNRAAADDLRARGDDRLAGQIARHLWNAGDSEAGAWAERAGDAAYVASMYADAATWFERALDSCTATAEPSLRLRHARALSRCGRAHEAEPLFLDVAATARAAGDAPLLAQAALGVGSIGGGFEVRQLDPAQQALLAEAIDALESDTDDDGDGDPTALSMLLSRLSIASAIDAGGAGHATRAALAERALAMARTTGDDTAIGAALGAWCDAHAGPGDTDARAVASAEMLIAARRCGDAELELLARRLALVAALEAGDIGMVKRHATAFAHLADGLRLAQFTWYARLIEGMLAHLAGHLDLAERLSGQAADLGRQAHSANAEMLADGALGPAIARDRGDPDFLDRVISINSGIPEATRGQDITAPFHVYAVGYGATHSDVRQGLPGWAQMWRSTGLHDGLCLFLGYHLARGAAFVGDAALMAEAEEALAPHTDRFALDGTGAVCYGPVSAALAAIAAARGDSTLAQQRYGEAIAACRRIGAPLLRARFEAELAAVGASSAPSGPVPTRRGTFHRDGDMWLIAFGGYETRLRHAKGLTDLAALLAAPDHDIHVFDLIGAAGADRADAGTTIDATARAAYEQRIRALTVQIETADERGDDARAAALDDERAELITHLASSLGLGRRPRIVGSDVERARKAVSGRLRDACKRIELQLPDLGRHLQNAVHTGTWCSYRPDTPIDWTV